MLGSAGGGAFVSRSAARRGDGGEGGAHQEDVQEDALHAVEPDVVAEVLVVILKIANCVFFRSTQTLLKMYLLHFRPNRPN